MLLLLIMDVPRITTNDQQVNAKIYSRQETNMTTTNFPLDCLEIHRFELIFT